MEVLSAWQYSGDMRLKSAVSYFPLLVVFTMVTSTKLPLKMFFSQSTKHLVKEEG